MESVRGCERKTIPLSGDVSRFIQLNIRGWVVQEGEHWAEKKEQGGVSQSGHEIDFSTFFLPVLKGYLGGIQKNNIKYNINKVWKIL